MRTISIVLLAVLSAGLCYSRTYEFKFVKGESETSSRGSLYKKSAKRDVFQLVIGPSSKIDCDDDIEIRAATLMKHIQSKKSFVNDVAHLTFTPDGGRRIFLITSGISAGTRDKYIHWSGDWSDGYIKGGVIVEIWQNGKCLKHFCSAQGPISKTSLTDEVECAYIDESGYKSSSHYFKNSTRIAEIETPRPKPKEQSRQ